MTPTIPNGEPQNGQLKASTRPRPETPTHSAKESLGQSAPSGLLKASLQAGIGFAIVFAGLTFGPYYWEKSQASTKASPEPAEKGAPAPPPVAVAPPPSTPNPKGPQPPTPGKPAGKDDILNKLGENGTKTAPGKTNPLDKSNDDLLKDIK